MLEVFRFGVVGVAGFLVDAGVLTLAMLLGSGPWLGRALSYLRGGHRDSFALNRAWTFKARAAGGNGWRQWGLWLVVNLVGFACNYGTYAALIVTVPLVARFPVLGWPPDHWRGSLAISCCHGVSSSGRRGPKRSDVCHETSR